MTSPLHQQAEPDIPESVANAYDVIPQQYRGLSSEIVAMLWESPVFVDPEKNRVEAERRRVALEAIKAIEDYLNFDYGNAETAPGVWWHAYESKAAKKLKKEGKFEWGKERIYFDIPTDQLEALSHLTRRIAGEQQIPIAFKFLDTSKSQPWASEDETRFVVNFVSVEDARKFYETLKKSVEYSRMKSDRNFDYHGHALDGVAHYASGYREQREALQRIVKTAKKNVDGTYSYKSADGREMKIEEWQYNKFQTDLDVLPNLKDVWENY